jgi:two-component system OmpR family sensor kinase
MMPIRIRLALWFGGLVSVVLALVSVTAYAIHTRAHYDDMDRDLIHAAEHVVVEYPTSTGGASGWVTPLAPDIIARVSDANGALAAASPNADVAPLVEPRAVLEHPGPRPFGRVASLAPSIVSASAGQGAFGLTRDSAGQRWRVYVLPLPNDRGFVLTAASLERLDLSSARFRSLLIVLDLGGIVVTGVASAFIAGRALRPVVVLNTAANDIASSRDFDRRVDVGSTRDELGQLAGTFNVMLDSLAVAYRAEQRFVSDASHELRAPLTIIQANLEFLERQPNLAPAERAEALGDASRETRRLSELVADLLALARADAGVTLRRQPVELDRILLDAIGNARKLARGQRVVLDGVTPVVVVGDADRLRQLFLILLDNAVKYTPPLGSVSVSLTVDGADCLVSVRDEGIGIPAEALPHVFERFFRAEPARTRDPGGAGLGLAIARWIVEQHGGDVTLESHPGHGTLAIARLPVSL